MLSDRNFVTLIESIAAELVVDPSLVEKDWYAMRLIGTLANIQHPDFQLVFSGGTSLSKGFGLIQRFSEDLDFKIQTSLKSASRSAYRAFRNQVLATIEADADVWQLDRSDLQSYDGSRAFKIPIKYQPHYKAAAALRPYIQLEVTFESPKQTPETCALHSFVSQAQKNAPEVPGIPCISPVETSADKLSALSWRVLDRDRSSSSDDPALIRHLHDLAALAPHIRSNRTFQDLAQQAVIKDTARFQNSSIADISVSERLQRMLQILQTDEVYATEYQNFVVGMSYASDEDRISFVAALDSLQELIAEVLKILSEITISDLP